ncbi:unnamed protein product [Meganyctiphanes norvegica]|uniref:Solute carrier family 35 member F4 n=1 Tax=Meganyctiphanes norvegica TaxID=48144 RepID=A0AAV2PSF3_MEGNR
MDVDSESGGGQRRPSIATIFNPRRSRGAPRPSVVVTDEDTPGPPLHLSNGAGGLTTRAAGHALPQGSAGVSGNSTTPLRSPSINMASPINHSNPDSASSAPQPQLSRCQKIKKAIFSTTTRKLLVGIVVTGCVTTSWVGATHIIKDMFQATVPILTKFPLTANLTNLTTSSGITVLPAPHPNLPDNPTRVPIQVFDAPFFLTWFCTAWTGLFFPLYLLCHSCLRRDKSSLRTTLKGIATNFRDRGVTFGKFLSRCCLFCLLWVAANYMYVCALRVLDCTDVMALYSSHVAFVYLLSWVILHDQFVGVRIVAVILCNTGIALLAYMDGIIRTETLGNVVLAAAAAAGSATYKVLFKKVVGEASFGQVSLFFTVIALVNTIMLSPVVAALYLFGYEVIIWEYLPWHHLLVAAALSLAANLLGNFGIAFTFEIFITLGLVFAVPVSAALDMEWYGVKFEGMKLAGIVMIVCGFFLVLFPGNWPEYITMLLRWGRRRKRNQPRQPPEPVDYRTGLISRSHLRSPSGLIR